MFQTLQFAKRCGALGGWSLGCYAVPTGKQLPIFQLNVVLSKRPLSVNIAYLMNYVTTWSFY